MSDATQPPDEKRAKRRSGKRAKKGSESPSLTVESTTPGRTQVRLSKELRTPESTAKIKEQLEQHPNVHSVEINQQTGSVVIKHDEHRQGHEVLKEAAKDREVLAGLLLEVPIGEEEGEDEGGGEYGKLDQGLADLVYRVDKAVYKRTGLRFRGQLLAGSIASLGILQLVVYGISLEMLPGPILLYIAYDVYHRESKEPPLDADDVAARTGSDSPAPAAEAPVPAAT